MRGMLSLEDQDHLSSAEQPRDQTYLQGPVMVDKRREQKEILHRADLKILP